MSHNLIFEFCHYLSCWVMSQFDFLIFSSSSQFEFLSFITIWVFGFCHFISFLIFVTIWVLEFSKNVNSWVYCFITIVGSSKKIVLKLFVFHHNFHRVLGPTNRETNQQLDKQNFTLDRGNSEIRGSPAPISY